MIAELVETLLGMVKFKHCFPWNIQRGGLHVSRQAVDEILGYKVHNG